MEALLFFEKHQDDQRIDAELKRAMQSSRELTISACRLAPGLDRGRS